SLAFSVAAFRANIIMTAMIDMMVITTISSMRVKPFLGLAGERLLWSRGGQRTGAKFNLTLHSFVLIGH
ncbi:MAG: hypothetical protein V3S07_00070, partial [Micropepsaceae bacterium]